MQICFANRELLLLCVFILGGEPNHLLNTAGKWFHLKLPHFVFMVGGILSQFSLGKLQNVGVPMYSSCLFIRQEEAITVKYITLGYTQV